MTLAPGAINYGAGDQRSIRFSGHSLDDSNFAFDGIDTSGVQEQTQKAETRLNIALDSIAEFRVSTSNYTAESRGCGRSTGQRGLEDRHEPVSRKHLLRRAKRPSGLTVAVRPARHSSIPSESIWRQLRRCDYQGPCVLLRQLRRASGRTLGGTYENFVPNAAYRARVLAASPVLAPLVNAYPLGQTPVDNVTDLVTKVASNTTREDAGMFRFDCRFSDATTMYARYNIDNAYIDNPQDALGDRNVIPHIPSNFVLQVQHIFFPSHRQRNEIRLQPGQLPQLELRNGTRERQHRHELRLSELQLTRHGSGEHILVHRQPNARPRPAHSEVRHRLPPHPTELNSGNTITTASISYDTADTFVANQAASATYLQGEGIVGDRRTFYQAYGQDEFKVSPNLTLNLGLRYEYYTVAHEILNRSAVVDIQGCGGYCPKGTPFYDPNPKNFGPRVGAAWALPRSLADALPSAAASASTMAANQNDDFSRPDGERRGSAILAYLGSIFQASLTR